MFDPMGRLISVSKNVSMTEAKLAPRCRLICFGKTGTGREDKSRRFLLSINRL